MEEIKEELTEEQTNGEDMLLVQIDAFRDKARQLQSLIAAKEQKVKDLEAEVSEKEARNIELQEELTRKQEEAEGLAADVEKQVDRMMQTLRGNMDNLEKRIEDQVANNQESAATQTQQMKQALEEMSNGLDAIKTDLSEKVHSESVLQYRNIHDLMKEMDNSEEVQAVTARKFLRLKKSTAWIIVITVFNMLISGASFALLLLIFGIL